GRGGERAPGDRTQDDRSAREREDARAFAQEEKDPDRVGDRLGHADERRARRRYELQSLDEQDVGAGELDDSEEGENRRGPRRKREVGRDEGKEGRDGHEVAPRHRGLRSAFSLALQGEDEPGPEDARRERHEVPAAPRAEPAHEE